MMPHIGTCLDCGAPLTGAYCARCAQPATVGRLTAGSLARDFVATVSSLDSALLRTGRELLVRPARLARAWIAGQRTRYASPLRLYLLMVAGNIAVVGILEALLLEGVATAEEGFWDRSFVAVQIALLYLGLLLPLATAARLLDRRGRYTLVEHYAFLLYLLTMAILAVLVAGVIAAVLFRSRLENDLDGLVFLAVFVLAFLRAGPRFYEEALWRMLPRLLAMGTALLVAAVLVDLVISRV